MIPYFRHFAELPLTGHLWLTSVAPTHLLENELGYQGMVAGALLSDWPLKNVK
jgi:hypothetical protein